jgi:PAS domain S-box-containing protein
MNSTEELRARCADLEARLAEAEDTLRAIRQNEVDALVISGPKGERVFTLQGADHAYRILVEQMSEGTITLDREGLILYSNQRFADMLQEPLDGVLGSNVTRFLSPESRTLLQAMLEASSASDPRGELAVVTPKGASVPVFVAMNRLEGPSEHRCAVVTDLTEQRRSQMILQEERLSRLILEQAAEAIVVIDPTGTVVRASEAAHRLAGRNVLLQSFDAMFPLRVERFSPPTADPNSAEESAGAHTNGRHSLRSQEDQRIDAAFLLSAAREGESFGGLEVSLPRLRQTRAALLLTIGALRQSDGELIGCVVTLADITQRKAAEDALAFQARQLESSNNDLRQFAYSASHDLKEPLRVISLYSELAWNRLAAQMDREAHGLFEQVIAAVGRMEALLRDLLAYTEAAEDISQPSTTIYAGEALNKALSALQPMIVEQSAQISSTDLPLLRMHEVHLVQLFQNLVSNALKYRSESIPVVRIAAERDREMWKFSVGDNGIGIAPDYQKQIFGLFKRLHSRGKYGGSGIGLAICQRIVERYGGRIWVESGSGAGSTFFFTVPAAGAAEIPAEEAAASEAR